VTACTAAPATTITIVAAEAGDADVPGAELVAGVRRELTLTITPINLPDDAQDVAVCARFRFTDLGRIVTARTIVGLASLDASVTREFEEFAWAGERVEELCLEGRDLPELPATVVAWAEGGAEASAGSAALSVFGGSSEPVEHVVVRYVARSEDVRSPLVSAASVVLRLAIGSGPWAVAGLGALGLLLLVPRPRVRTDA
jgi:hypothetical protein